MAGQAAKLTALSFAVDCKCWQNLGLPRKKFMSFAAIGLAVALLNGPAVPSPASDPAFQVSPCKQGYEWDAKKKKCVRKGLDY